MLVAPDLIGKQLRHGDVLLRITEVEAYCYDSDPQRMDSANHCARGRTERNAPMWEAGGLAYIYLCYGMHHMLNLVTGPEGHGEAVLIRSCEPVEGLEIIRSRRGGLPGPALLTGPGKVAQALGLDRSFNFHPLFEAGGLELWDGSKLASIVAGPRIGIDYANPEHRLAPWRFAEGGNPWVSHRKGLIPVAISQG